MSRLMPTRGSPTHDACQESMQADELIHED